MIELDAAVAAFSAAVAAFSLRGAVTTYRTPRPPDDVWGTPKQWLLSAGVWTVCFVVHAPGVP